MLYESMAPLLRRSPGLVCAVADTRQLATDACQLVEISSI
jgi:hypothetical protein